MAEPSGALSGAQRIRSLTRDDDVFQAFDSYPWNKDKTFMSGLHAILGDPSDPQGSLIDMATHARIFYYAQKIGVTIDFSRYQAWISQHPNHRLPDVLPDEYVTKEQAATHPPSQPPASAPSLPWQQAAPKTDLYIDRKSAAAAQSQSSGDEPAYPMRFAEMIKLLQEGKEVPGIRQIPNTVLRDPSVKPVGSRTAPRKPWEKSAASLTAESNVPQAIDTEFPPIDAVPSQSS